jgi:hypothetical protein
VLLRLILFFTFLFVLALTLSPIYVHITHLQEIHFILLKICSDIDNNSNEKSTKSLNDVDIQSLYLRMERVYMVYTFELYMAALIFMREAC